LAVIALLFRLVLLFAIPNLSQDFYRFIWDGKLILEGLNPYLSIPGRALSGAEVPFDEKLIDGMGNLSAGNFTNYPPISQFCYAIAAWIGGKSILGSIIVMRFLIIAADFGTLWFGRKLLQKFKLPEHRIFWYALNPFIIIELTGNLHFEGVMLFLLIASLYFLLQKKWVWAAVLFGLSVSTKLLPLMLLPLFFNYFRKNKRLGLAKLVGYYAIVSVVALLTFFPFLDSALLQNLGSSLALWFQKFEFNASVYYIIRWIGYQIVGWNIIATVGKILPMIVLAVVLGLAFFRKNNSSPQLVVSMLFAVSAYFFLSTTVHPWYIATPLLFSIFTKFRFALVWSFVVFLSYSAYDKTGVDENLWLVALEYLVVFGVLIYELKNRRGGKSA
jgi:Gpi18-like mannosyltransferase